MRALSRRSRGSGPPQANGAVAHQLGIPRPIHLPHTALTEAVDYLVVAECFADQCDGFLSGEVRGFASLNDRSETVIEIDAFLVGLRPLIKNSSFLAEKLKQREPPEANLPTIRHWTPRGQTKRGGANGGRKRCQAGRPEERLKT